MTENIDFKVPLVKKPFVIKKVSKLEKTANALEDVKEPVEPENKSPLIQKEQEKDTKVSIENIKLQIPKIERLEESADKPSLISSSSSSTPPEQLSVPYKEPEWAGFDERSALYGIDIIKQGVSIGEISLKEKSLFIIGRLASCDIQLEHPSISRYHAVMQYKKGGGWFLYDLGSTHGSLLNKRKLPPRKYMRLYTGHVMKFGGSSRLLVLTGPEEDKEEEGVLKKKVVKEEGSTVCGWGMVEEVEEEDDGVNPFAEVEDDSIYKDDPKKALKKVYQREGAEGPEFQFEGVGLNRVCRLELPLEGPSGETLVAEVRVPGNKRDAEVACALEACRVLDANGLLRETKHESMHKRKKRTLEENDFYDEDDDLYLDRTGDVERKRKERIKRIGQKTTNNVVSHETLVEELKGAVAEMDELQSKLNKDAELQKKIKDEDGDGDDALELFMKGLKAGGLGAREKMDMKRRLLDLKQTRVRLERLVEVSKPTVILLKPPPAACKVQERCDGSVIRVDDNADDDVVEEGEKEEVGEGKVEKKDAVVGMDVGECEGIKDVHCQKSETDGKEIIKNKDKDKSHNFETTSTSSSSNSETENINNTVENPLPKKSMNEKIIEDKKAKSIDKSKMKKAKKEAPLLVDEEIESEADKHSTWLPPSNQSGDGKTNLNQRFGY